MPYSFEYHKKHLPEHLDRRRKLSTADKMEIISRYKTGTCSLNSLAFEYGVSKKTILLIVNPSSKAKNDQHIRDNWKKYVKSKNEHNKIVTEHRHYKHQLDLENKLEQPEV